MAEYNRLIAADENFNVIPEVRKKIIDSQELSDKLSSLKSTIIAESKELPISGKTGQVLSKTDTGVSWVDQKKELPSGGTEGQALVRSGSGVTWAEVASEQWDEEAQAQAQGFWIVAGTEKPSYSTKYGVPVYWLDTNIVRDPSEWAPTPPTFNLATQKYTIPNDDGAVYKISGNVVQPGEYSVTTTPTVIDIYAEAKPGYTLAGVTSWSKKFTNTLSAYDAAVINLDLEHYYRLADSTSWNKNNGRLTPLNLTSQFAAGSDIGTGYKSATTTNNIVITPYPPKEMSTFTFGVVVRPTTSGIMTNMLVNTWDRSTFFEIINPYKTGTYEFRLSNNGVVASSGNYDGLFVSTKTHFVVMTLKDGVAKLYIDGELKVTNSGVSAIKQSIGIGVSVGRDTSGTSTGVASIILDSSKALTADEISTLYKSLVI